MKQLAAYVLEYIRDINKPALFFISLLTGFFVFLNYQFYIEWSVFRIHSFYGRFAAFSILYLAMFGGCYLVLYKSRSGGSTIRKAPQLALLVIFAAVLFAWRMSSMLITSPLTSMLNAPWDRYWAIILNPPVKCLVIILCIYLVTNAAKYTVDLTGLRRSQISLKPFLILLLCFVPVILLSALQADFRMVYPKASKIGFVSGYLSRPWLAAILFEISYSFDFIVAEVFFRGFLVLAFIRYAGPSAILPMASFYCAIHFGKPAIECISSFFGAILLGIVSWRTRSVLGGLVLHLGMGWMMEIAGFLIR